MKIITKGVVFMKKRLFVIFALCTMLNALYAGPFGLSKGMTFEEVTEACNGKRPIRLENDDRYLIEPAKTHSTFKTYCAWISEDYGLYYIRAVSDEIMTNDYGTELKKAFYSFEPRIEKIYGTGHVFDDITDKDSVWTDDKYWFKSLSQGARELYAEWSPKKGEKVLKDDLSYIRLWVTESGYKSGILLLDYEFINHEQAEEKEDDVL